MDQGQIMGQGQILSQGHVQGYGRGQGQCVCGCSWSPFEPPPSLLGALRNCLWSCVIVLIEG